MKKIGSFLLQWIIWIIIAFLEAKDSGDYFTGLAVLFVAFGVFVFVAPAIIFGWSLSTLPYSAAAYLFIGLVFNETINKRFGHRLFP